MIADRYLERRFREGYIVGFKEGFKEGYKEEFKKGYAEGKAEICQRIRQILDHPPTELTPETRAGLTRALAELEKAPVPDNIGYGRRRLGHSGCCRPGV